MACFSSNIYKYNRALTPIKIIKHLRAVFFFCFKFKRCWFFFFKVYLYFHCQLEKEKDINKADKNNNKIGVYLQMISIYYYDVSLFYAISFLCGKSNTIRHTFLDRPFYQTISA